jgi:hypothetical protein
LGKTLPKGIPAKKHLPVQVTCPEQTHHATFPTGTSKVPVEGWTEDHHLVQTSVTPSVEAEYGDHGACPDQSQVGFVYACASRGDLVVLQKAHHPKFEFSFFTGGKIFVKGDPFTEYSFKAARERNLDCGPFSAADLTLEKFPNGKGKDQDGDNDYPIHLFEFPIHAFVTKPALAEQRKNQGIAC